MEEIVREIVQTIKQKIVETPDVAIVLGSGLSNVADMLENKVVIKYDELPNMPKSSVKGHKNQFICGKWCEKYVILMQGRLHYYDGFLAKQVALPIYIFKCLGVKTLIVTNSAGAVNKTYNVGDLMLITDHINFTGQNPLIGGAVIDFGEQFIDMTEPYDMQYVELLKDIAKKQKIQLKTGTYMQFTGPSYETKAEIKMASTIGADAVGMSTVLEVIAARQCGIKTVGISVMSNMATGISTEKMSHEEVLKLGQSSSKKLGLLIAEFLKEI